MNKKLLIALTAAIIVIAGGALYASTRQEAKPDSQVGIASSRAQAGSPSIALNNQVVTKVGTIECLSTKGTAGPQTTSCAVGIKLDDGTSYALNADDPTLTGSLQTGQRVQVTGTLGSQSSPQYNAAGVIQVQSVQ